MHILLLSATIRPRMEAKVETKNPRVAEMFEIGAHFGFTKARRHPSAKPFIFGAKNRIEIFDLEKTSQEFENVLEFVKKIGQEGKTILFVGGKNEAKDAVVLAGDKTDMPYVAGRWIGGTLTNFSEIRKRIDRMLRLKSEREKGELAKYTKKERLLIDREIDKLEERFGGLVNLTQKPGAMVVIDTNREDIAVAEAHKMGVKVVALCGTDCNLSHADVAFPGNDASKKTISYFLTHVADAYTEGKKSVPEKTASEKSEKTKTE